MTEQREYQFTGEICGHPMVFAIAHDDISNCVECARAIRYDDGESALVEWRYPEGVVAVCEQCQDRGRT